MVGASNCRIEMSKCRKKQFVRQIIKMEKFHDEGMRQWILYWISAISASKLQV